MNRCEGLGMTESLKSTVKMFVSIIFNWPFLKINKFETFFSLKVLKRDMKC